MYRFFCWFSFVVLGSKWILGKYSTIEYTPSPNSRLFYFLNKNFIRKYSLYGGFVVTIPIRLILYIIYIVPIVCPPQPPPYPT
jgi:hypothetical protein